MDTFDLVRSTIELIQMIPVGIILFILAITLGVWLLQAFAIFCLANRRDDIEYPWLAFIPFAQNYILGYIIGDIDVFGYKTEARWVLLFGPFVSSTLSRIPLLGFLFPIALTVYQFIAYYKLFKKFNDEYAVILIVVTILTFSMALPFILFIYRNSFTGGLTFEPALFNPEKVDAQYGSAPGYQQNYQQDYAPGGQAQDAVKHCSHCGAVMEGWSNLCKACGQISAHTKEVPPPAPR